MKKYLLLMVTVLVLALVGCEQEKTPDKVTCKENQTLVGDVCKDNEPDPIVCGDDQTLVGDVCVDNEPDPIVCDDPLELVDGVCVLVEVVCEAPYENVDNVCVIVTCNEHFDRIDGVCVRTSCEKDFELVDGICIEAAPHPLEIAIENTKLLDNYEMSIVVANGDIVETMIVKIDGSVGYIKYLGEERFFEKEEDVCYEYYYGSDIFVKEVVDCLETDIAPSYLHLLEFAWFDTTDSPYTIDSAFDASLNMLINGVMDFSVGIDGGYIQTIMYSLNNGALDIDVAMTIQTINGVDVKIPLVQE